MDVLVIPDFVDQQKFLQKFPGGAVPENWVFVPSGDPALTRRLKRDGAFCPVKKKVRNRLIDVGLFAHADQVLKHRQELAEARSQPEYQRKRTAARRYRERQEENYREEFYAALIRYLDFAPVFSIEAETLAHAVVDHALPVNSGTVARTKRIALEQRVEAALIAWMRHQTTTYDQMKIARVKGARREIRRKLSERSRQILQQYRSGVTPPSTCPLAAALKQLSAASDMRTAQKEIRSQVSGSLLGELDGTLGF